MFPNFEVFDNRFTLFDGDAPNPQFWGVYSRFKSLKSPGFVEAYYLGFQVDQALYDNAIGEETRHTIGARRFGVIKGRLQYNSEIIFQFGKVGNQNVSAFNIETDWHYLFKDSKDSKVGLKLEYTSGDRDNTDDKLNTFNPMFVNPAYYSLATTVTPMNLISVHPSFSMKPRKDVNVYLEWASFWRASKDDGLYRPARFFARTGENVQDKTIGHQIAWSVNYQLNRNISFNVFSSYFIAGNFLEASGASEDIFHIAPTINIRF